MADRPILFSAPMVRALLDGRKTQTRRVLTNLNGKGHVSEFGPSDTEGYDWHFRDQDKRWHDVSTERLKELLRWHVGDRLYVREAWAEVGSMDPGLFITRADYPACVPRHYENVPATDEVKWRPGIHMPRARSRLTLTVTDVRVQRIQDIRHADAAAEGVLPFAPHRAPQGGDCNGDSSGFDDCARCAFRKLWIDIHGAGKNGVQAWFKNPWVVAVTFTVERRNIDAAGD